MSGPRRVAVVVAATSGGRNAIDRASRFAVEVRGRGAVLLIDGTEAGLDAETVRRIPGVLIVRGAPRALAPALWRDGLRATDAPLVAFTTTAMEPATGWLDALIARIEATDAAAVGGPIEPGAGLSATDRAVYLLRYANYLRPTPPSGVDPPGDNSLYRTDRLLGLDDLIDRGFWETEVQRALVRRGDRFATAGAATVTYRGGVRLATVALERFRHGRIYGASRGSRMTVWERSTRLTAAPLVPVVLGLRVWRTLRARGESVGAWASAAGAFAVLSTAWAAGEAVGLACGDAAGHEVVPGRVFPLVRAQGQGAGS